MIDFAGLRAELDLRRRVESSFRLVRPRPDQVHVSLTDRCHLSCTHCDIWMKPKPGELPVERWIEVVDELRGWLGPFTLKLVGGEPLLKEGLTRLLAHAHGLGCRTGLSTTAVALAKPERAQEMIDTGLDEIHVSLESARPDHHDRIRNRPGAHAQTLKAIGELSRRRTHLQISLATVITEQNLGELLSVVDLVRDLGLYTVNFQPLYANFGRDFDPDWWRTSPYFPQSLAKLDAILDRLIEVRQTEWIVGNTVDQLRMLKVYFRNPNEDDRAICKAGDRDIAFDPYGNLRMCFWLDPVGNVRTESARASYQSHEARDRRRQVRECTRNCNLLNCNFDKERFGDSLLGRMGLARG
jgi:MoaA/NifB/PqqE/SkfB family radical SAM enzyme